MTTEHTTTETISEATTPYHLLLAGDVGGTNTRLALYDRDPCFGDSSETSFRGRYNRPLFVKEYRNEDTLVGTIRSSSSGSSSDANSGNVETDAASSKNDGNDCCNENVQNFVQKLIAPFLEEAYTSGAAIMDGASKNSKACIFCCLGVAGPVDSFRDNGTVTISQSEYLIGLNGRGILEAYRRQLEHRRETIATATAFVVKGSVVINDFVAQGYGCLSLSPSTLSGELQVLKRRRNNNNTPNANATGPKFCVGAGTGFGSCYMVPTTTTTLSDNSATSIGVVEYTCFPSEYGQSDWAPPPPTPTSNNTTAETIESNDGRDDLWRLLNYLQEKRNSERSHKTTPHIAVSHVVSGTGLATAYECLSGLFPELANERVREKFDSETDFKGRVVGEHFSDCPICKRAVEAVVRYVGSMVFL